jgi:hypothetical protein
MSSWIMPPWDARLSGHFLMRRKELRRKTVMDEVAAGSRDYYAINSATLALESRAWEWLFGVTKRGCDPPG